MTTLLDDGLNLLDEMADYPTTADPGDDVPNKASEPGDSPAVGPAYVPSEDPHAPTETRPEVDPTNVPETPNQASEPEARPAVGAPYVPSEGEKSPTETRPDVDPEPDSEPAEPEDMTVDPSPDTPSEPVDPETGSPDVEPNGPTPNPEPVEPDVTQPEPVPEPDPEEEKRFRDAPPGADTESTEGETQSMSFDPADHTVGEVKTYVNENPDKADAVRLSESGGRQRVTLIEWLNEKIDSTTEEN